MSRRYPSSLSACETYAPRRPIERRSGFASRLGNRLLYDARDVGTDRRSAELGAVNTPERWTDLRSWFRGATSLPLAEVGPKPSPARPMCCVTCLSSFQILKRVKNRNPARRRGLPAPVVSVATSPDFVPEVFEFVGQFRDRGVVCLRRLVFPRVRSEGWDVSGFELACQCVPDRSANSQA